jgi:hypothetical protein
MPQMAGMVRVFRRARRDSSVGCVRCRTGRCVLRRREVLRLKAKTSCQGHLPALHLANGDLVSSSSLSEWIASNSPLPESEVDEPTRINSRAYLSLAETKLHASVVSRFSFFHSVSRLVTPENSSPLSLSSRRPRIRLPCPLSFPLASRHICLGSTMEPS